MKPASTIAITNITTEDQIGNLAISNDDVIASYSGTVSTSDTTIDLSALASVDNLVLVKGTAPVAFTSIKAIFVHNKSTANAITITPAVSESFLPASEQMTIPANSGKAVYCGASVAITSDSNDKFLIKGAGATDEVEIYFYGA